MPSPFDLTISRREMLGLAACTLPGFGLVACANQSAPASADESGNAATDVTGIIGAMESEVEAIKAAMSDTKTTTISGVEFCDGSIGGKRVVVAQCGVGKVNAGICAQTLIVAFEAKRLINTGVAGSLDSGLSINDFVVSTDAVQHDYDVSVLGFKKGEIPYTGMVAFPADEQMRSLAVEAVKRAAPSSQVLEGRVCSGDQFIATAEQVKAITDEFGGLCAEMEGAAIAQVCYLNEVPYVIIRAISDSGDDTEFEQFQAQAAEECANAVLEMVNSL